ncbi:hypothetical protein GOP47_0028672 [Adiantum capillus-veneris]|nr:hypothetical protein GOP47_0028672 [Adiantum capillus-veneris]
MVESPSILASTSAAASLSARGVAQNDPSATRWTAVLAASWVASGTTELNAARSLAAGNASWQQGASKMSASTLIDSTGLAARRTSRVPSGVAACKDPPRLSATWTGQA